MKKILHIGKRFPDARIEKSMISDMNRGDNPSIVNYEYGVPAFKEVGKCAQYKMPFGHAQHFGSKYEVTIKAFKEVMDDADPDLLHVHDIYNAAFINYIQNKLGVFGTPWIYNDHEAWGEIIKHSKPIDSIFSKKFWFRYLGWQIRKFKFKGWEKKIFSKDRAVITVSRLARERIFNKFGINSQLVKNYPMSYETDGVEFSDDRSFSIAVIENFSVKSKKYRDTKGFIGNVMNTKNIDVQLVVIGDPKMKSLVDISDAPNYKKIEVHGIIPHMEIYDAIKGCMLGALPFHKHEHQFMSDSNKAYMYAHMGLVVLGPTTFCMDDLYYLAYDTMTQLPVLLEQFNKENIYPSPTEIAAEARANLIWEKQEDKITTATEFAMERWDCA